MDFIKNALSPAKVAHVVILDETKKQALALVDDSQLSLAIGKQGLNVRLANRLVDWNIDVKTNMQFEEMDIAAATKKKVSALFGDIEEDEEIEKIQELPGITPELTEILVKNNIELIETLVSMKDEELLALDGMTQEYLTQIKNIMEETIEIVEEEEEQEVTVLQEEEQAEEQVTAPQETTTGEEEEAEEESYECPECGHKITAEMTSCPNCGVGLSFEEEQEEQEEEGE
jgi:N utilization substance protein A